MDAFLRMAVGDRRLACLTVAEQKGLQAASVDKDSLGFAGDASPDPGAEQQAALVGGHEGRPCLPSFRF